MLNAWDKSSRLPGSIERNSPNIIYIYIVSRKSILLRRKKLKDTSGYGYKGKGKGAKRHVSHEIHC